MQTVACLAQSSRIRIFRFFSNFKKHDFLRFFEMTYQKVVKIFSKSLVLNPSKWVHILRSVITVIQFPADPRVWSILSHCWTSSVNDVRFWQQWRGTINIKQPWKLYVRFFYVFNVFLKIKKTGLFTFFWVVAHVFSNTVLAETASAVPRTGPCMCRTYATASSVFTLSVCLCLSAQKPKNFWSQIDTSRLALLAWRCARRHFFTTGRHYNENI